jgi:hypothetical protein
VASQRLQSSGLNSSRAEDVDFCLLVCEPALVPFYSAGLAQARRPPRDPAGTVPFTFNLPMTTRVTSLGPPW